MKHAIYFLNFILISLFTLSCTSKAEEKWAKTLKVHDDIMVKMQTNGQLEAKLNDLLIAAQKDTTTVLYAQSDQLKAALEDLIKADEEMMDWMANIKAPKKGMDMDSVVSALQVKEEEIIAVGEHMDRAATNAQAILNSLKK